MNALNNFIAGFNNVIENINSIEFFKPVNDVILYLSGVFYNLYIDFLAAASFTMEECKPLFDGVAELHSDYNNAEEEFLEDLFEDIYFFCWFRKIDFWEFTTQYLTGFSVDDFRFFKHHGDEPYAVNTQGGYEDICLYVFNGLFHVENFITFHIVPVFNDFCVDYYISTENLEYGPAFVIGAFCIWVIYDYMKTGVDVQMHIHRLESMQITAITEYLRNNKIIYKNKKLQDSFEDRQYNAGGYDRERFVETLMHDKEIKEKLSKITRPGEYGIHNVGTHFGVNLGSKNNNKVEESEAFRSPKDPNVREDVTVDYTIDAMEPGKLDKKLRGTAEFIRRCMLADAIHLFEILDSKELRFWIFISDLSDLPKNLFRLLTLLYGGFKTMVAVSWPSHGTHEDVDYKIYLDLFTIDEGFLNRRILFNKGVLNYVYDFYVEYFKDPAVDVSVIVERYINHRLKVDGRYRKKTVRLVMKDYDMFFGLRLLLVLDLMEFKYPSVYFIRFFPLICINLIRALVLYFLRIWGRFLQMPFIERFKAFLVKKKYMRVISPLEEASRFGFIPSSARGDIIGFMNTLDKAEIHHYFHVSYYNGGKKKTYIMGLKDIFLQIINFELFYPRNLKLLRGMEPFWINHYDLAFRYRVKESFRYYYQAKIHMFFIFFIRKNIYRPINRFIKSTFRKTGTGEMYMFVTFLRLWYESSLYKIYKLLASYFVYGKDAAYLTDLDMPGKVIADSKYTRKLALETMRDKNKNGFFFYYPYVVRYMLRMQNQLYFGFDEEDELEYTDEEYYLELDYKEDHDNLFESDFQLRKNGRRDLMSGYALTNESLRLGRKTGDHCYDFYNDSEQLGGDNRKEGIHMSGVPYIQNASKPVRETFTKQKQSYRPFMHFDPYRADIMIKNWASAYRLNEDIELMEKEALYLLYYHVNSPVNGFFTSSGEVDDGYYMTENTIFKDADFLVNEYEEDMYPYMTKYAYGPFGSNFDEYPTLLEYPDVVLTQRLAHRKGHISKKGRYLGKGNYYRNLTVPLKFSMMYVMLHNAFAYANTPLLHEDQKTGEQEVKDSVNVHQEDQDQDVHTKIRLRFEKFLQENKGLRNEFNSLLQNVHESSDIRGLKVIEELLIGTKNYNKELKNLESREASIKKAYDDFIKKLKD